MVKPKLPAIHQLNCFTCVTLLYLHSNCCSPTVICAQKNDSFQKERQGMEDRETLRERGRRKETQQMDTERGEQQIKSPVTSPTECMTFERLQEAVQILTISPSSNTISHIGPNHLPVCLSGRSSHCFIMKAIIASWSPYLTNDLAHHHPAHINTCV